jgi:hypothetical protein
MMWCTYGLNKYSEIMCSKYIVLPINLNLIYIYFEVIIYLDKNLQEYYKLMAVFCYDTFFNKYYMQLKINTEKYLPGY